MYLRSTDQCRHDKAKQHSIGLSGDITTPNPEWPLTIPMLGVRGRYKRVDRFPDFLLESGDFLGGKTARSLTLQVADVLVVDYVADNHLHRPRDAGQDLRSHGVVVYDPPLVALV